MARIIICCLVICLAVLFGEACPETSSRISYSRPGSDRIGDSEVSAVAADNFLHAHRVPGGSSLYGYPKFDPDSHVIELRDKPPVSQRFRRDVDSKKDSIFKSIDMNGNKYIEICEWVKEGGSALNFVAFLSDDDTDGDEKISWQEFQAVNV